MVQHQKLNQLFLCLLALILYSCDSEYYSEADYYKAPKIDAHVHIYSTDPSIVETSMNEKLRLITINTNAGLSVTNQRDTALALIKKHPQSIFYLATITFDTAKWNALDWEQKTIEELSENTLQGSVGVKLWKNIGMVERDRTGEFIMISNKKFDPVISFIEQKGIPLTGHFGEPRNCWLPLDSMTVNNDRGYFREHPQYHMYLHPEYPSYQDQMEARDSMLRKHPNLRFIGCHLASLEWDVDELAKTLDRFPNMAVDLAARICHLQYQSAKDPEKVRNFLIKYQERIIYGTDIEYSAERLESSFYSEIHTTRLNDWNYFTGSEEMSSDNFEIPFTGLHLPKQVIDKIFYLNAVKWYKLDS
jgi:predicted TIM-barrel fold metal-dependent hydrolase